MNIESRGASLPQKSSVELRAQLGANQIIGQNCSPQAAHIHQLEEKLSKVHQQLEKEVRKSQLLEQELAHLRSLTLQHSKDRIFSSSAITAQHTPNGVQASRAADPYLPKHDLNPVQRPRSHSIDGKPSPSALGSPDHMHRACSASAEPAQRPQKHTSMDKIISSALHAVSGAYLKEQAQHQSSSLAKRQQPMSETESKAHLFIEKAHPVPISKASKSVTISTQAFELMVLKDRAINAVKEGITIADCSLPDHPLIFANDAFSKITGYSREEVLGKNCRFLQGPGTDREEIQNMRDAAREGTPSVHHLMNYKKNGDPFINYLSITPIHDSKGHVTHFMGIQSDISDLVNHKKAEMAAKHEAAQAAAATEVKSQFLARMSHEIRTPLNGMIAVGQLLAETVLSPAQWDLMNTIRCSGETLLTLITDILDFSRIEADKMVLAPSEFHLQTVIEAAMEIAGLHAAQKRLQVAYNVADNVPKLVTCDAQRLQQVLLNVLNNAVKFTEKGEVLLEVWYDNPTSDAPAKHAQQASCDSQDSSNAVPANQGDAGEACHQQQQQQQQQRPLFGKLSQESGQLVENNLPRLEPFRPLTPDNLSQHTELAEMRQQLQGPEPRLEEDLPANIGAVAASFDAAYSGKECLASSAQQAEQAVTHPAGCELPTKQHQLPASTTQQAQGAESSPSAAASQRQQQLGAAQNSSSSQEAGSTRASSNSFANAAPATTKAGQQHILDTSTASAAPRAAARSSTEAAAAAESAAIAEAAPQAEACVGPEQATCHPCQEGVTEAGPGPHSEGQRRAGLSAGFDTTVEEEVEECTSSVCHHGQKVDGSAVDSCIRRDTSTGLISGHPADEPADDSCSGRENDNTVSTRGHSADEPAYYTLNFSVRDSGIGISNDSMNSLFQCFAQVDASPTRRFGGSGLGLAICKRLTEAMGGRMWVESDGLGKGSVFRWTLEAKAQSHNSLMPRSNSNGDKGVRVARKASDFSTSSGNSSSSTLKVSDSSSHISKGSSSGARALHHNRSSAEWHHGGGGVAGSTVESGLALFAGKKVLLVEVCDMVRQVLALALRRWGFQVCAVKNEEDAINKLRLRDGHSDFLAACKRRAEGKLSLEHSGTNIQDPKLCDCNGPFDVVILDMGLTQLVMALMQGVDAEASTLVFLGWPGQNEPQDDDLSAHLDSNTPFSMSPMHSQASTSYSDNISGLNLGSNPISAQMSQDTAEKMINRPIGSKQLMYAIVTRPVRQGRLKVALEEVLTTQPDSSDPAPPVQAPLTAAAIAAASATAASASAQPMNNALTIRSSPSHPASSDGMPNQMLGSSASLAASQDAQAESLLASRRGSDRLSTAHSASGFLLPSQSDPALRNSTDSTPSPCGTMEFESALQSRRHSLHRAPKLRGPSTLSELAEVEGLRRKLKVLLAEDNLINMKVALGILKRTGYSEVTTVVDGRQAMEELHRRGGADAFDIILTDLHMPHKGGMEMVTEIRQLWPESKVRVVAVTADAFEDRRDQCLTSGFDGWLAKPFRVEDLVKIMEAVS